MNQITHLKGIVHALEAMDLMFVVDFCLVEDLLDLI